MQTVSFKNLSLLRPSMTVQTLKAALGELWIEPTLEQEGLFFSLISEYGFGVRLDKKGCVGELHFHNTFASDVSIENVYIGMSLSELQERFSHLSFQVTLIPKQRHDSYISYTTVLNSGYELEVLFLNDKVDMFCLRDQTAEYNDVFASDPQLKQAYDLMALPARLMQDTQDPMWQQGWLMGCPPGIKPSSWPLSYKTAYPLRHAFTLRLPQSYRVHGPEYVALSLFVEDQGEYQRPESWVQVSELMASFEQTKVPEEPYQFLWQHHLLAHPHSFRMSDLYGQEYVALWLTEQEFLGPLCEPPHLENETLLLDVPAPSWLKSNSQSYFKSLRVFDSNGLPLKYLNTDVWKMAFPIEVLKRDADPNVGLAPSESSMRSYVPMFSAQGQALDLPRWAGKSHLGGTLGASLRSSMRLSPYYLEIEGHFGGIHKGRGVGHMDLKMMRMDWIWD